MDAAPLSLKVDSNPVVVAEELSAGGGDDSNEIAARPAANHTTCRASRGCCCKGCLGGVLLVVIVAVVYFVAANALYHGVKPRDLPCTPKGIDNSTKCFDVTAADGSTYKLHGRKVVPSTASLKTPIVVLCGGPSQSIDTFHPYTGLDRLAVDRAVFTYDQRGSGYSQMLATATYDVTQVVAEIELIRVQLLRVEKIILMGHSAGGALAQHYAATHPRRIEKLVLVGSTQADNGKSSTILFKTLVGGLFGFALGFPPQDPAKADKWLEAQFNTPDQPGRECEGQPFSTVADGPARFSTWFAVDQSLVGTLDKSMQAKLSAFGAPALVVAGACDNLDPDTGTGPPAAQRIKSGLGNATVAVIEDASHWPFAQNSNAFFRAVNDFLAT
jgi:pimeloyl-ACP methyl ester carboxylesterase